MADLSVSCDNCGPGEHGIKPGENRIAYGGGTFCCKGCLIEANAPRPRELLRTMQWAGESLFNVREDVRAGRVSASDICRAIERVEELLDLRGLGDYV